MKERVNDGGREEKERELHLLNDVPGRGEGGEEGGGSVLHKEWNRVCGVIRTHCIT